MKTRFIAALALITLTGTANAADMPRYDVERQCDQVASMGGSKSPTLMNSCMDMEQTAYDNLKPQWASIPENIREQCNQVASMGGSGSYSLLEQCIKMETDAASKPKKFKF